jgi:hypothetical protein
MKTVTLIFPSKKELWEFQKILNTDNYELVFHRCMLIGEFSKEMIETAISKFGAYVTVRQWFKPLL